MRKPSAPFLAVVGLAAVVAAAGTARAQRGVDSEVFRPALDSYGIFTVDRAQTSHQWDWGFKLFVDYAQNPLRLDICADRRTCAVSMSQKPPLTSVMGWQAVMHFGFHLGLTDWLELVADIPVSAAGLHRRVRRLRLGGSIEPSQRAPASTPTRRSPTCRRPNAAPLDWRLGFKARLFRAGMFGMAAAAGRHDAVRRRRRPSSATATSPSARSSSPTSRAGRSPPPSTSAPSSAPRRPCCAPERSDGPRQPRIAHRRQPRADLVGRLRLPLRPLGRHRRRSLRLRAAGDLGDNNRLDAGKDFTADVAGGFQFFPIKDIAVGVGAGAGLLGTSMRHDDFRVFGGISWAPAEGKGAVAAGGIDTDGDGIPDAQDLCPTEAEDKDGFEDEDGCPDPDNDQRRHPRQARQVPERAGGQGRLPGRRRLPRGRQRRRRHPRRAGQVPERSGRQGRLPGRRRLPGSRQRRRRHPRRHGQVPERAGDAQRRRRRRRLPGFGRSGHHRRRQDRAAREHQLRHRLRHHRRPLAGADGPHRREDQVEPAGEADPHRRPHRRRAAAPRRTRSCRRPAPSRSATSSSRRASRPTGSRRSATATRDRSTNARRLMLARRTAASSSSSWSSRDDAARTLHSFIVAASLFSAATALAQDVALPEPVAQPAKPGTATRASPRSRSTSIARSISPTS